MYTTIISKLKLGCLVVIETAFTQPAINVFQKL